MSVGKSPPVTGPLQWPSSRAQIVVAEIVRRIVSSELPPGHLLPPESQLCAEFGVSRTVIRESVKRIEEKGLVVVAQGRRTIVTESTTWSMLDPVVLRSLIEHDVTLGVLDQITVVRANLEASMAGDVAADNEQPALSRLQDILHRMKTHLDNPSAFDKDDADFHHLVMDLSPNRLAANIAGTLYDQALESARYRGMAPKGVQTTAYEEHSHIFAAIRMGKRDTAEVAMRNHILDGWKRRRLPTGTSRPLP